MLPLDSVMQVSHVLQGRLTREHNWPMGSNSFTMHLMPFGVVTYIARAILVVSTLVAAAFRIMQARADALSEMPHDRCALSIAHHLLCTADAPGMFSMHGHL